MLKKKKNELVFILSLLSVSQALLFTSEMFTFRLNLDIDDFGLSETDQQHIKHVTHQPPLV